MPSFDIVKTSDVKRSFRVASIIGMFDMDENHASERFTGSIDIEDKDWNIGLIVGGSGTGKSTIAKEVFPDYYIKGYEYTATSCIDDMPESADTKSITKAFTSVGFASPPSWMKPYSVLSNGERMRCDLARACLEDRDIVVFDEFTSVVNREVAKTGAYAISKAVRKAGRKFVAVACHRDIVEWLEPDWIFDTDTMQFFFAKANTGNQKSGSTFTKSTAQSVRESGRLLQSITI